MIAPVSVLVLSIEALVCVFVFAAVVCWLIVNLVRYQRWAIRRRTRLCAVAVCRHPAQFETLENRRVMAGVADPVLAQLDDVVLLSGSPLHIPLNATDADGQSVSFSASSDNANLTTFIPNGNRSAVVKVAGFGDMVFELFEGRAPRATSRFITLAESGFYDGLTFDEVIDGFTIGTGDPSGTGTGGSPLGPYADQFHLDLQHNRTGVLTTNKDFDDTNDSRFLITEGDNRDLDFVSTIFGLLVLGESVREAISNLPTDDDDHPLEPPVIESIEIINDAANGVLMLKAPEGFTGTAEVTVVAMDTDGGTVEQSFDVDIQPDSFDSDPFLDDVPLLTTTVDTPVSFNLTYFDAEGDDTIYFDDDLLLANGLPLPTPTPAGLAYSIDGLTGELTVTPSNGMLGTYSIWVATGTRLSTFPDTPKEAFIDYQEVKVRITGVGEEQIDVATSLVHEQSATDASGERNDVPASDVWIDEFGEAWLEVWLTSGVSAQGVEGISIDIGYDPRRFAALQVFAGPGFTRDRDAAIDNSLGLITGLQATTTRDDLGDDRPVLFARVRLRARLDAAQNAIDDYMRPESTPLFSVRQTSSPINLGATIDLPAPESVAYFPVMYDLDDTGLVGFGDLAVFSASFLRPVGSGAGTFAADFDRSGQVDFGDFSLFTANFLSNRGTVGNLAYASNFPTDWLPDALLLKEATYENGSSASGTNGAPILSEADLAATLDEAVIRIRNLLGPEVVAKIDSINIRIADLPGNRLGQFDGGTIRIDRDAAGHGWFVDAKLNDDAEFIASVSGDLIARSESAAANRVDLLSVVMHELGHVLRLDHLEPDTADGNSTTDFAFMLDTLPLGVRRTSRD